jgi:hypothetical protein
MCLGTSGLKKGRELGNDKVKRGGDRKEK